MSSQFKILFILVAVVILLLGIVDSESTKISPGQIILVMGSSEKKCENIFIYPDADFIIETRWRKNWSENILDYKNYFKILF